jgi:hypothetical protein
MGGDQAALPFVGLVGSEQQTERVATSLGVVLEPPKRQPDGSVGVVHGTQLMAFIRGSSHLVWLTDATADVTSPYADDITKLASQYHL